MTRQHAACVAVLSILETMVVPDAVRDQRFSDNALATGRPHSRRYASAVLMTQDGDRLGAFAASTNMRVQS